MILIGSFTNNCKGAILPSHPTLKFGVYGQFHSIVIVSSIVMVMVNGRGHCHSLGPGPGDNTNDPFE